MYWLFIILAFQPLGGIVYALVAVLPELTGGSTARRLGQAAKQALDPEREYREAKIAVDDSATVGNRMRLAAAAAGLGRHEEAARLYGEAATGIHEEDPSLLLGRARALHQMLSHPCHLRMSAFRVIPRPGGRALRHSRTRKGSRPFR